MGTRPKPTEHMATSESETANRRQVAENVRDDSSVQPPQQQESPILQRTDYIQIYPPHQIQHYPSNTTSTSLTSQLPTVSGMTSGAIQAIHPPLIPLAIHHQTIDTSISEPRIRIASNLYIKPELLELPGPSGLQQASQQSFKVETTVPLSKKSSSSKTVACTICQKKFLNQTKLQNHWKSAHVDVKAEESSSESTPFLCEHCNKTFSSKFKLVRHALIHSDRRQFSCTVCERTFHRKDHLKNHIKVHSPMKKIYICDRQHCKKEYTSALSFKKHLAIHFAEEGNLDCKICTKKFESKQDILFHLKIHAGTRPIKNPNEKKFRCDHCERKFFTRKDVRRHLVVHTGRRDFLCQFCPQRFGRKDHLVRHIKKSHSSEELERRESEIPKFIKKETSTYEILSRTSETSSSYFIGETKSLKSEETQQYTPARLLSPSQHSRFTIIDSIKVEPVKIEENFELVTTSESTSTPSYQYEIESKNRDVIVPSTQYSTPVMPSSTYTTEQHLLPTGFNIETSSSSFIQHVSDTNMFSSASESLFHTDTFASLNPMLTSSSELLLEQQPTISIELGQQTSAESMLEHQYQNILQSEHSALHNPDLLDLISESDLIIPSNDEDSKPLPGFSQAFQNQPPPKDQ